MLHDRPGLREFSYPLWAGREPEEAFGSDDARPGLIEERVKLRRIEGFARTVDETRNPVLQCLRVMILWPVQFLVPGRVRMGRFETEQASVEDSF